MYVGRMLTADVCVFCVRRNTGASGEDVAAAAKPDHTKSVHEGHRTAACHAIHVAATGLVPRLLAAQPGIAIQAATVAPDIRAAVEPGTDEVDESAADNGGRWFARPTARQTAYQQSGYVTVAYLLRRRRNGSLGSTPVSWGLYFITKKSK